MTQPTPRATIHASCDALGIVGTDFREHLAKELPPKVLLRRGRDVVLLTGATGAGKECAAAALHDSARRHLGRTGELVQVNCANLSGQLFDSELFGHRRGAFTGADRQFGGLVRKAQHGTLVLDEVQSLEPQAQARLLRFLGERQYRPVGDDTTHISDALIVLCSNRNLRKMADANIFRRDLLDRASAKIRVPSLYERRRDIAELAQRFAREVASELGNDSFYGLTRRASADIEAAILQSKEVSVRRLREVMRDMVFQAAVDCLPEALESDMVRPVLQREFGFGDDVKQQQDVRDLQEEFPLVVGMATLHALAARHRISAGAISNLCKAVQAIVDEMDDVPRNYRNIVERTNRLSKVALWLVSGAKSQADFRRYFGSTPSEMPTKSVAHQVYYEVHPKADDAGVNDQSERVRALLEAEFGHGLAGLGGKR